MTASDVEATLVLGGVIVDDTKGVDAGAKMLVETGVFSTDTDELVVPEDEDVDSAGSPSAPVEHPVRTTTDTNSVSRRKPDIQDIADTFRFC